MPLLKIIMLGLAALFLTGTVAADSNRTRDQPDETGGLVAVDRLMSDFIAEQRVPGAALALVRHGRLIYARGFGLGDRERGLPVTPRSLFRIASVSKPLTAAAIMHLVETRRLELERPMLTLLAEAVRHAPGVPGDRRLGVVTVRHLLEHTAGWDRAQSGFFPLRTSSLVAICGRAGIAPPGTPETVVAHMLAQPLEFSPGTRFAYANIDYLILGRVITAVSGEPYETYVRNHLLLPLGIRDMQIGGSHPDKRAPGEVCYYSAFDARVEAAFGPMRGQQIPLPYARSIEIQEAAGGWLASAVDLARFLAAFHDAQPIAILKPQTVRRMISPPSAAPPAAAADHPIAYALGWFVERDAQGRPIVYHTGRLPGSGAYIGWRSDGLGVVVLFNSDTNRHNAPLVRLFLAALAPVVDGIAVWPAHDLFPHYFP